MTSIYNPSTKKYVPYDLTIASAPSLNTFKTTGIFSVDITATNTPSDLPTWSDELVLQVWQSGEGNGTQLLYTANGTSSTQIGRIYFRMWSGTSFSTWRKVATGNEYMPMHLVEPAYYNGDVDLLRDTGLYTVNSASTNLPSPLVANAITIEVIRVFQSSSSGPLGIRQICRQNIYSSSIHSIQQNRTYERGYTSSGVWGEWRIITTGGISGDLINMNDNVDLNSSPFRNLTGIWAIGEQSTGSNFPTDYPTASESNVLETISLSTDSQAVSQKIMCCEHTETDSYYKEWKRVLSNSSAAVSSDWYQYQFHGDTISSHIADVVTLAGVGTINVAKSHCIDLNTLSGDITGTTGAVTGQVLKFIKTDDANDVTFTHESGVGQQFRCPQKTDKILTDYEGIEIVYNGSYWHWSSN